MVKNRIDLFDMVILFLVRLFIFLYFEWFKSLVFFWFDGYMLVISCYRYLVYIFIFFVLMSFYYEF